MSLSQYYGYDPVGQFCALRTHSTLVLDDKLYIVGGYANFYNSSGSVAWQGAGNPYLRYVDLTKTFDVTNVYSQIQIVDNETFPYDVQMTTSNVLWYDQVDRKAYYAFGIGASNDSFNIENNPNPSWYNPGKPGVMWTADYKEGPGNNLVNWKPVDMDFKGEVETTYITRYQAYDQKSRKGYTVGGLPTNYAPDGKYVHEASFIEFDAKSMKWTNSTLPLGRVSGFGAFNQMTVNGRLVLIFVGGFINYLPQDMTVAHIYDVESKTWYTQQLSAVDDKFPISREYLCTEVVSAPDASSHSLLMFGGVEVNTSTTKIAPSFGGKPIVSELWALNIPAFEWVLLDQSLSTIAPRQRIGSACNVVNNHVLLISGGANLPTDNGMQPHCDSQGAMLFFMDLNKLEWMATYDGSDKTPYQVPEKISKRVGGGPNGSATVTEPSGGWDNNKLATIFHVTSAGSTSTPTLSPTGSSSSNKGAVIGGVIGGIIGGILLAALGLFLFRWRQRRKEAQLEEMPRPPSSFRNSAFDGQDNGNANKEKPIAELATPSLGSPDLSTPGGWGRRRTPSELSGISSPATFMQGSPSELSGSEWDANGGRKKYKSTLSPVELE